MTDEQKRVIKEWCYESNFLMEEQEKKLLETHPELQVKWQLKALITGDADLQHYFQTREIEEIASLGHIPNIKQLYPHKTLREKYPE